MSDEAREIASRMIQEHGVDGAINEATEEILAAHRDGDFLALSVWREVRRALRERKSTTQNARHIV